MIFLENKLISKIAIGTVQFGLDYGINNLEGVTPIHEVSKILDFCREKGIDTLDTAYAYGDSENILGKIGVRDFNIISKFPNANDISVRDYAYESLKRINIDCFMGYISHNAEILLKNHNLWYDLLELKESGLVEKTGYSLYEPRELEGLLKENFIPDVIQIPYSIIDNRFSQYFSELNNYNVEIHTRSSFLQGLLFMNPNDLDSFFNPVKPLLSYFNELKVTTAERAGILLQYCLSNNYISKVVIGINSFNQLAQNIESISNGHEITFDFDFHIPEEILLPYNWPKNK